MNELLKTGLMGWDKEELINLIETLSNKHKLDIEQDIKDHVGEYF